MKKLCTFIILLVFFAACQNHDRDTSKNVTTQDTAQIKAYPKNDSISRAQIEIKLDTFSHAPADTINGCGAYFAADSLKYANTNLILMTNIQGLAIIKINNHFIFLKSPKEPGEDTTHNDKTYNETYYGEGYTVTLKTDFVRNDGEELAIYKGTLEISNGRDKAVFTIYGGLGC